MTQWRPLRPYGRWPEVNPTPFDPRISTYTPESSISDSKVSDVSVRKITGIGIKVYRASTQSISDNTITAVAFDTTSFNEGFPTPTGATFTAITLPYTGVYTITQLTQFATDPDGTRDVGLDIDAGGAIFYDGCRLDATSGGVWRNSTVTVRRMTAGQTIGTLVRHTAGAALNLSGGEDDNGLTILFMFEI